MFGSRSRQVMASDDWIREQQLRAELEAEAWRRLRGHLGGQAEALAPGEYVPPAPGERPASRFDHHGAGSAVLKALVRFLMAGALAYLAWLAAIDSGLGVVELWLAVGATFAATLALSMLGFAREIVHALAEAARWGLITCLALAGLWVAFQTWG